MSLGFRLKLLRESKKWNRREAANNLETVYTTYVSYENDEREPGHSFLIKVAKLYGVSTDYLLGLIDEATYIEAAKMKSENEKLSELPEEERQMIDDLIELRYQKWLKDKND